MEVRPAREADVPAVAALQAAWSGDPLALLQTRIAVELTEPGRRLWVAAAGTEIAGYGRLTWHAGIGGTAPAGFYLGGMVVARTHRRRGIGTALVEVRMAAAFAEADELWYFTRPSNEPSIALHRALGFVAVPGGYTFPGVDFPAAFFRAGPAARNQG